MKRNLSFDPKNQHLKTQFPSKLTRLPMENITNRFDTSTQFRQNQRIPLNNFQQQDIFTPNTNEIPQMPFMNQEGEFEFERIQRTDVHYYQNESFRSDFYPPPEKMYLPPPEPLPQGVSFEFDYILPTFEDDSIQLEPLPLLKSLF